MGALMIGLIVAGAIILFLAVREIMTWYWKIDTILKYQDEQTELMKQILIELRKKNEHLPTGSRVEFN
jgi:hypothetical protein